MTIKGAPGDLQIYNASYDDATNKAAFGGFIFQGYRVPWDAVSPGMVQVNNGKQEFVGGSYSFTEPNTGAHFDITCEAGAQVPAISRKIQISADAKKGILIDGVAHSRGELVSKDGAYELNCAGASISLLFPPNCSNYDKMAEAINLASERYDWRVTYTGSKEVQAVDAGLVQNLRISKTTADMISQDEKLSLTVRADQTGIWLENGAGAPGTEIPGSRKTWAEMNIDDADWNSGNKLSSNFTYRYSDDDKVNDTYVSFDFTLDEVTSIDSVIDDLDGMQIDGRNITNSYQAVPNFTLDGNLLSASLTGGDKVHFSEEKALGRDFETQVVPDVSRNTAAYDASSPKMELSFSDASGSEVIKYTCDSKQNEDLLQTDLSAFLSNIMSAMEKAVIAGQDPSAAQPETIRDILGDDKITKDGYLSDGLQNDGTPMLTLTSDMLLTNGGKGSAYQPGQIGHSYPSAHLDFGAIGNGRHIYELVGTGFNSDCKTCDNYYSARFEDFSKGNVAGVKTTDEGYRYAVRKISQPNSGSVNYSLRIDIHSLMQQGVSTGEQLTSALISIMSECFDMHFTQYAAKGSMFYIYDNRPKDGSEKNAMFDTLPMPRINKDEFLFHLTTDDGRTADLRYEYDFSDIKDWVEIKMTDDPAGDYVKDAANGGYRKYDSALDAGADRFSMTTSYWDKRYPGSPVLLSSISEMIGAYTEHALSKMAENSDISLGAKDFTYIHADGDEKPNVAIKAVFESSLSKTMTDTSLHIQNSGIVKDFVKIPRFRMNTLVLNLQDANTLTCEDAQETIGMADDAIRILSAKRSIYGMWQNRLEHIWANSYNAEENAQASESRIRDADMADEMMNYSRHSILEKTGQAMLAQTNRSAQNVLSLIGAN